DYEVAVAATLGDVHDDVNLDGSECRRPAVAFMAGRMISESVPFCQILVEPVTGRAPVAATSSPREQLNEAMRLSLLPQRFPFRRDVEFYGGLSPQAGRVLAYDYHWPRKNLLAASVVSIAADGLEGSLRATA